MDQRPISSVSTDFQPTTSNPQGNVGGGLQPNSADLQPTTVTNGANSFNQPGINPQAFPSVNSLRVLGSTTAVPNTTTTTPEMTTQPGGTDTLTVFMIIVVVAIAVLLLLAKIAKPKREDHEQASDRPVTVSDAVRPKTKKKKARVKNKAARRHR